MNSKAACAGLLAALGVAASLIRCTGGDTSACDACIDVTPTPLSVGVVPDEIWVKPNETRPLAVTLTRGPSGVGDVDVAVAGGGGIVASAIKIPAGSSQGTLDITVPPTFTQGSITITIDAVDVADSVLAQTTLIIHIVGSPGTLDTSFGASGVLDLPPNTGNDVGTALIGLQSGMVVGGTHTEATDASSVSTMKVLRVTSGGAVDGTFTVTSAPGELSSLAMLHDGRIYAVGDVRTPKADFTAVRILPSGGLDSHYAVTTSLTSQGDLAFAGAVQPGGNLVAAGTAGGAAFALARYTQTPIFIDAGFIDAADSGDATLVDSGPNTSVLDPTFGSGGVTLTSFAQTSAGARALLVSPDGSLFALGFATSDIVAVRYTPSGALDSTFGDAGNVMLPLTTGTFGAAAAILEPSGAIDIASDDSGQALLVRLLATGALDGTFGKTGSVALTIGSASAARALARDQANGTLLVGGSTGSPHQCFVARVSSAGVLDTTFASQGVLLITGPAACDVAGLAIDDQGLIVVLETLTTSGGGTHMAVARYWP